jgi:hypothetical protein
MAKAEKVFQEYCICFWGKKKGEEHHYEEVIFFKTKSPEKAMKRFQDERKSRYNHEKHDSILNLDFYEVTRKKIRYKK